MYSWEEQNKIREYTEKLAQETLKKLEKQIQDALNQNNILSEITLQQYKQKYNSNANLSFNTQVRKSKKEWDNLALQV